MLTSQQGRPPGHAPHVFNPVSEGTCCCPALASEDWALLWPVLDGNLMAPLSHTSAQPTNSMATLAPTRSHGRSSVQQHAWGLGALFLDLQILRRDICKDEVGCTVIALLSSSPSTPTAHLLILSPHPTPQPHHRAVVGVMCTRWSPWWAGKCGRRAKRQKQDAIQNCADRGSDHVFVFFLSPIEPARPIPCTWLPAACASRPSLPARC